MFSFLHSSSSAIFLFSVVNCYKCSYVAEFHARKCKLYESRGDCNLYVYCSLFWFVFFSQFVEFKFLPDNSFAQRQDCQYSINWSLLNFSLPQKRLNIVNFNFNF